PWPAPSTSMRAAAWRGVDPRVAITVAIASGSSPSRAARRASMVPAYPGGPAPGDPSAGLEGEDVTDDLAQAGALLLLGQEAGLVLELLPPAPDVGHPDRLLEAGEHRRVVEGIAHVDVRREVVGAAMEHLADDELARRQLVEHGRP